MKKITDFIKNHKIIISILTFAVVIVAIDSILTGDYSKFSSFCESVIYLVIFGFIFYLMVSRKDFLCPECGEKVNKKDYSCKKCGYEFKKGKQKPISKRTYMRSKFYFLIGRSIILIPIAMGFLALLFAPIAYATSGRSITLANTLFIFYTNDAFLPITVLFTIIGLALILIAFLYKKKGK